jgi:hypothetical protein
MFYAFGVTLFRWPEQVFAASIHSKAEDRAQKGNSNIKSCRKSHRDPDILTCRKQPGLRR